MSDARSPLADFSGSARLFPLPNVVLFPQVIQPLHIFEPRYRQMTEDALAGDRLIALVLLQPGWDEAEGPPPIHEVACLGRIVADQRLDDGRFNLLLRGLSRFRISHEVPHDRAYRLARGELLDDVEVTEPGPRRRLRKELLRLVPTWFPAQEAILEQFRKLLKSDLALGALADIVAYALPIELAIKQELLEECDAGRRLRRLLEYLQTTEPPKPTANSDRKFPPDFSLN
jgi:Lon protease-like protein